MRTKFFTLLLMTALASAARAQDQKSEVSVQGTGFFTRDADGQGLRQIGTRTGGFLAGYRYHFSRMLAAEANYGYARNTQSYLGAGTPARIQANIHEITGALVVTGPALREKIHPFALAGGGALIFDPTGNPGGSFPGSTSETRGAFLYGGGVDYDLRKRIALRLEYRGLVYKAPDFNLPELNIDKVTHAAQPSAGLVFRFW